MLSVGCIRLSLNGTVYVIFMSGRGVHSDQGIGFFLRRTVKTCLFMQFYRATKSGTSQESGNEITQSDLSGTANSGLESLQKYTLAAMQSENEALKAELKKYQNASFISIILSLNAFYIECN